LNLEEQKINIDKIENIKLEDYQSKDNNGKLINSPINTIIDSSKISIIVGNNGGGKTTLVEALIGLNKRYNGKIMINNKELIEELLEDIVYIQAKPHISHLGNLKEYTKKSSGQQKLAQIKFNILTDKSVYIFDEPTNFLDNIHKDEVWGIIENLKNKGKIVIVVTNDLFVKNKENTNKIILNS